MAKPVINRISKIKRPSKEYPRRFLNRSQQFSTWKKIEPIFEDLVKRKLDSPLAVEQWLLDWSEVDSALTEEGNRRRIKMACNTDDPTVVKDNAQFINGILSNWRNMGHQLDLKLLECKYIKDLDQDRYGVLLKIVKNQVEIYRLKNVHYEAELSQLIHQYQRIMGFITVDFKGAERTHHEMLLYLQDPDRNLRKEAWEALIERRTWDTEQLDNLFDRMVRIRNEIAKNSGFKDYIEYRFRGLNRFEYSVEDCLEFHRTIEEYIVPLKRRTLEERCEAMGLDTVRPWDTNCDRFCRKPLEPFNSPRRLVTGCGKVLSRIDQEMGDCFKMIIDLGLIDLDSRPGKAPGGFQASLAEVRLPFIFMNAIGTHDNLRTLLHEGGHAFHQYLARDEELFAYRRAPNEFNEVVSMSAELLGSDHFEVFYSKADAARARLEDLTGNINRFPFIAMIDAFQHWVYTNPEHTHEERDQEWSDLAKRFGAGVDYSGYEEVVKHGWQSVLHIFQAPFYYIEYAIALLGALQIWMNSRSSYKKTIEDYKDALRLGGSRHLRDLYKTSGIEFDFSKKTVQPLVEYLEKEFLDQVKLDNQDSH